MNIVCISASQVPSSTANSIQVLKACQAMQQLGHQVTLLVPGRTPAAWESLASHYGLEQRFEVEWLPAHPRLKRYDFSMTAVHRALHLKADLVYAWPPQAAVYARLRGVPVLLELHGEPEGRLGPAVLGQFLKLPGRKRLLPITHALLERVEARYGFRLDPEQVVVVSNGVDLERYMALPDPEEARQRLGLPQGFTAGYTGHMYPGRGMGLLFELARLFPQVNFLWVGGRPSDIQAWQPRLAEQEITNVTLTGFIENSRLPLYQAAAEVLLMPYETYIEGSSGGNSVDICSPMKMFEYMAAGRAILSSNLPVIGEVLDEEQARLLPPEEVGVWAAALQEMIDQPQERLRMGERARRQVEWYTWQERARRALAGFPG
jgi:glycosyltransferase involved in cell wall biosynthesis